MGADLLSGSDHGLEQRLTSVFAGLPVSDVALAAAVAAWRAAREAASVAQAAAQTATVAKKNARQKAVEFARQKIRQLQADPTLSDVIRAEMGLKSRDRKPPRVAPPSAAPRLIVEAAGRGRHTFKFYVAAGEAGTSRLA